MVAASDGHFLLHHLKLFCDGVEVKDICKMQLNTLNSEGAYASQTLYLYSLHHPPKVWNHQRQQRCHQMGRQKLHAMGQRASVGPLSHFGS